MQVAKHARLHKLVAASFLLIALGGTFTAICQPAWAGDFEEGVKLYQAKQFSQALPFFERSLKQFPSHWQVHMYLAHTYLGLGKFATAKGHYEWVRDNVKDSATKDTCQECLDRISKYQGGGGAAAATTASAAGESSKDGGGGKESEGNGLSDAEKKLASDRERVMSMAKAAAEKVRQECKEQISHEKATANQWYKYPDGHLATDIDDKREEEIKREADEKVQKIMEEAERKCKSMGK